MRGLAFYPLDTLFFRDGTPFTMGDTAQEGVSGSFPPFPPTLVGAIRAALAAGKGWDRADKKWPEALNEIIGDGPDNLGRLSFVGPIILQEGRTLFPVPLNLLGTTEQPQQTKEGQTGDTDEPRWIPKALLRPGSPICCDLGDAVRLPEIPKNNDEKTKLKPATAWRIVPQGLEAVLRGGLPSSEMVVPDGQLWTHEPRVGLERDLKLRSAKEHMLYSTQHVRLKEGVGIGVLVDGLPDGWQWPTGSVLPFGGESRAVECREWHVGVSVKPPSDEIYRTGRFTLIALTPLATEEGIRPGKNAIPGLGEAEVVSACVERPQRIGGWDSVNHSPLPLRNYLPPGSVLFCRGERDVVRQVIERQQLDGTGLLRVGLRREAGFGLVALGTWHE